MVTHLTSKNASQGEQAAAIVAELSKFTPGTINGQQEERHKALELSRKLTAALEGPVNRATELVFKPFITIAARIAVGLDLFSHTAAHGAWSITSKELAHRTGGEEMLISRILRLMASVHFVEEAAMASAPISAGHRFVFDVLVSSAIKAPKFLRETGYKAPTEPTDGFVQYANQTKYDIFDYLASMPSLFQDFNLFMGNTMGSRAYWCDWYDVKGRVLDGFDESKGPALLVDVAGGNGHDLQIFHDKFKQKGYPGKLVLQELPKVLEGIKEGELDAKIERAEYDFFTEQPARGACTYFMHHILHDWSNKYCHLLLKRLYDAMVPGYSKLLIHDLILPDTGAVEIQARFDLTMMTFNGGMERSRSQWKKLLEDSGFKVLGLWEHFDADGIVEAEVPVAE
ncbi:sterigmatocystin 8-O-methyltransferase [Zopfia rhizophila CBS 207.26]|uniref:Sterigmatocystin 8-O-methyltransferase n=1 Tax=Zopfia rhizophila CBS 207.26 TaxID=1314779 RepID=A0A6A6E0W4_9PEZI|nr:sterigmatocystin 8-O-methyltransferase [Zopfia rhizophila CBS 207.26]